MPRLPRREITQRGGVRTGWEGPRNAWQHHFYVFFINTSSMDGIIIHEGKVWSFPHETEKKFSTVGVNIWRIYFILGVCCSAQLWPRWLENNIYRVAHLTSFITKSHSTASPMKLGVNPSSASLLFLSLPLRLIQAYTSHPLTFTFAKDAKENFGVISKIVVTASKVKVTKRE